MSFLSDLFGGGGGQANVGTTNVTTTGAIAPEAKPFVEEIFGEAQKQFKEDEFKLFPGPRIAEFDPLQEKAFTGIESLADTGLAGSPDLASSAFYTQQAKDAAAKGLQELTPADIERLTNPFQQAVTDIEKREAIRQFESTIDPQISKQAVDAGAFGGSREAILRAEGRKNLREQLGDIQSKGSLQAYNEALAEFGRERQRQAAGAGQYAGFAQQFPAQAARELSAVQAVGETKQARDQRALDIALSDFLTEEAFPQQQLGTYASLIRGFPISGRSTQEVQSLPSVPLSQQLMGLAGTGLAAYKAFGGKKTGGQVGSLLRGMQSGGQIQGGGLASLERHANNVIDPLYAMLGPRPAGRTNPTGLRRWLRAKARIDSLREQRVPDEQIVEIVQTEISPQRRELSIEELRSLPLSPENMVKEYDVLSRGDVPRPEGYISQREMEDMVLPKTADEYGVIRRQPERKRDGLSQFISGGEARDPSKYSVADPIRQLQEYAKMDKRMEGAEEYGVIKDREANLERLRRDTQRRGSAWEGLGDLTFETTPSQEVPLRKGDMTEYFNALAAQDERRQGRQDAIKYSGTTETHPFLRLQKDDPVKESRIFDVPDRDKSKYQMGKELIQELQRGARRDSRPPVDYMGPSYAVEEEEETVFEPHGPGGAGTRIPKEMVEGRAPYNELFEMVKGRAVSPQLDEFEPAGPGGGREPYDKGEITAILETINMPRGRKHGLLPDELRDMEDFELRNLMDTMGASRGWKGRKKNKSRLLNPSRRPINRRAAGGLISLANGNQVGKELMASLQGGGRQGTFEESEVIDTSSPLSFIPGNAPNTASRNPLDIRLNKYLTGIDEQREDLKQRRIKEDERLAGLAEKRTALSEQQAKADKTNAWLEAAQMFADFGSGKNFDPRLGFFGNAMASIDLSGIKDINSDKAQRVIDELATDERLVTEAIARDSIQADENNAFSLDELRVLGVLDNRELKRAAVQSAASQQAWQNTLEIYKIDATAAKSTEDNERINRGLRTAAVKHMTNISGEGWKSMVAGMAGVDEDGEYINETLMKDGQVQPLAQALFPHIQNIIAMKIEEAPLGEVQDSSHNAVQHGESKFISEHVTSLEKLDPKQQEELVTKFANYMEIIGYDTAKKHMKKAYDDLKITNEDDGKKYFDKENKGVTKKYYDTLITLFESVE